MTLAIILTALVWAVHIVTAIVTIDQPDDVRMATSNTFIIAVVVTVVVWLVYWIF